VVIVTHVSLQFMPTHQSELLPLAAVNWNVTVPGHAVGASVSEASPGWPPLPPLPPVPEPPAPPIPVVVDPVVLPVDAVDAVDADVLAPALPLCVPPSGC
jgi:hypothetical protein